MLKILAGIILILTCGGINAAAQMEQERVWTFSHYLGINFNTTPPSPFIQLNLGSGTGESCASVADLSGNLLFYTNGSVVWDAGHNPMFNGTNLTGLGVDATISTSQGSLIVPFPDNPDRYYLFSLTQNELAADRGRLYYSVVDMSLNGGMGAVVAGLKGILVDTGMAEKMIAIEGNACNVWVVIRTLYEHVHAYEITPAGLNLTPVSSFVGSPVNWADGFTGQFAAAPGRNLLAETSISAASMSGSGMWLHDFDPNTGQVSNSRSLLSGIGAYGVCFSPGGNRLYVQADSLYQYSLNPMSTPDIIASKTTIYNLGLTAIKRGPDNRLYCKYFDPLTGPDHKLGCIRQPELAGTGCDFNPSEITLANSFGPGLPNNIASRIVPKDTIYSLIYDSVACFGVPPLVLNALIGTGSNYTWNTGATGPQLSVTAGGTYRVGYNITPCVYRIDSFRVWSPSGIIPAVQTAPACPGSDNGKAWVQTGGSSLSLRWTLAADTVTLSVSDSLLNVPSGHYQLHIITEHGCDTTLLFFVPEEDRQVSFTCSDTLICLGEEVVLINTTASSFTTYRWETGDGTVSTVPDTLRHTYTSPGRYRVSLTGGDGSACLDTASRYIDVDNPSAAVAFTIDRHQLCTGEAIVLLAGQDSTVTDYYWTFGDGTERRQTEPGARHAYDTPGTLWITLHTRFRKCPAQDHKDSVQVFPLPYVDLGPDTVLCLRDQPLTLRNHRPYQEGDQYWWSTGAVSREIKAVHHGDYSLSVTSKEGCRNTETLRILKDCYIDIPNAFTPNGDGVNDYFFPRQLLSGNITMFHMQVFNRWGQVVFESRRGDGRGWDGKFNGKEQPEGVYLYRIETDIAGAHREMYQGNVTLIR